MSSLLRTLEKRMIKKMGVKRGSSGQIVDSDGRVVGRGPHGTNYPSFADIVGKVNEQNDSDA